MSNAPNSACNVMTVNNAGATMTNNSVKNILVEIDFDIAPTHITSIHMIYIHTYFNGSYTQFKKNRNYEFSKSEDGI